MARSLRFRHRPPAQPVSVVTAPEGLAKVVLNMDLEVTRTPVKLILYTHDAESHHQSLEALGIPVNHNSTFVLRPFYSTGFGGFFYPNIHRVNKRNGSCGCGDQACRELGFDEPVGTRIFYVAETDIEERQAWLRKLAGKKEQARLKYQERKAAAKV